MLLTRRLLVRSGVGAAGYAIGEALLAVAALAAWRARGRPRPPLLCTSMRAAALRHPLLVALAVVVGGACLQELRLLATPPNNWDSMTYHLNPRGRVAAEGAPQGRAGADDERINALQPGGEEAHPLDVRLPPRGHRRGPAAARRTARVPFGVCAMARGIGFGRAASAFAALMTGTLTEIALQSVTTCRTT